MTAHPLEELRETVLRLHTDGDHSDPFISRHAVLSILDAFIKAHTRLMDADDIRLDDLHRCGFRVRLCAIPETECPDQRVAEAGDGV
jgi:hypothetical protein